MGTVVRVLGYTRAWDTISERERLGLFYGFSCFHVEGSCAEGFQVRWPRSIACGSCRSILLYL